MKDLKDTRFLLALAAAGAVVLAFADTGFARDRGARDRGGRDFAFADGGRGRSGSGFSWGGPVRRGLPRRALAHREGRRRESHHGYWRRGGRDRDYGRRYGNHVPHRPLLRRRQRRSVPFRVGWPDRGRGGGFSITIIIR